ncbi:hypothetical protein M1N54_04045 [Thermodesulfovibrionales bacterium]|nr:hypothetical protein [Thermodesulfovibrionales bacterium]
MVVAIHAFGRKEHNSMLLDMSEYQRIIEELEEVESIRAYDATKTSKKVFSKKGWEQDMNSSNLTALPPKPNSNSNHRFISHFQDISILSVVV